MSYTCTFPWLARPSRVRMSVPDVATGVFSWEEHRVMGPGGTGQQNSRLSGLEMGEMGRCVLKKI